MVREPQKVGRVSLGAAIYAALLSMFAFAMVAPRVAAQSFSDSTLLGISLAAVCLVGVISIILLILIAVWMYRDAEKRGKSGALWVILLILSTLLLSIVGLVVIVIVWLIVRPPIQQMPPPQYGYMPPPQYPPQYPPQQPPAQPPTQP